MPDETPVPAPTEPPPDAADRLAAAMLIAKGLHEVAMALRQR